MRVASLVYVKVSVPQTPTHTAEGPSIIPYEYAYPCTGLKGGLLV